MPACRSCGATVTWVRTTQGRMMPLDPHPRADGNLVLTGSTATARAGGRVPVVRYLDGEAPSLPGIDPGERFVSHFATCPHADEWRQP